MILNHATYKIKLNEIVFPYIILSDCYKIVSSSIK